MEVLPFYKERMNSNDLNSLFSEIAFDYRNMSQLIEQYAGEMQEETLWKIFRDYNSAVDRAKSMSDDEKGRIIPFDKHAEEEPHFLYDMAKIYYDKKLEDEQFEAQYVDAIVSQFSLSDQLKFASEYKERIPAISTEKIEEVMLKGEEKLDTKDILANYQGILSRDTIVALINAQPFEEKMESIKKCNLSGKEKEKVIAFARKENKGSNVSFLEIAVSAAELEKKSRGNSVGNQSSRNSDLRDSEKI